jgi:chromosome segregation ATPase
MPGFFKMMNNLKLAVITGVGAILLSSPAVYLAYRYNTEKDLKLQLKAVLDETLEEREQLQKQTAELEKTISEKEEKIKSLSDVAAIRSAFFRAQETVENLNRELASVSNEKASLHEDNLSLKTRLENIGREFKRTNEELTKAQEELAKFSSGQAGALKRKIEELERLNQYKEQDLSNLKSELLKLQQSHQDLVLTNQSLEKQLKGQEKRGQAAAISGSGPDSDLVGQFQENISELKTLLAQKENQIQQLSLDILRFNSLPSSRAANLNKEQQKTIDNLDIANRELKSRIAQLQDELDNARSEVKSRKNSQEVTTLYEKAKDQIEKLTEVLLKKELEIDSAKKESIAAKENLIALQTKMADLERTLGNSKIGDAKASELEKQNLSLQARLSELQETLNRKAELADSLQKNIQYLTEQLTTKEEEVRSVAAKFATMDITARDELSRQKSRYEEINLLYGSLKTQIAQFLDALNQKDAELETKRKETTLAKEEFTVLKSRTESLEKDLRDAKDRQRKTLDDLVAAVKLSTILQEKLREVAPQKVIPGAAPQAGKEKAEELKRKIEVILEPER